MLATITVPYTIPTEVKFASIHSNPPWRATDIPAMIMRKYGKVNIIWSAVPLECCEDELGRNVFFNVVNTLMEGKKYSFKTDAPYNVELTLFKNGNTMYVNTVNLNERGKINCINPFEIKVYTEKQPKSIKFCRIEKMWILLSMTVM